MTRMVTIAVRVTDWQALRPLNRDVLLDLAQEAGATPYRLLRNVANAARAQVVAELPDDAAAQEFERDVAAELTVLPDHRPAGDRVWETTGLEEIG